MREIFGLHLIAPTEAVERDAAPGWFKTGLSRHSKAGTNQSESDPSGTGLLIRTPYGQRFRNAILFTGSPDLAGRGLPQVAMRGKIGNDSAGNVVRSMAPLYNPPSGGGGSAAGFRDMLGAFASRAAYVIMVGRAVRYQGMLPTDVQPVASKPYPWLDPTRGMP